MIYLWLKALHVAAVLCWTGGLLAAAVAIAARRALPEAVGPGHRTAIELISRWDRRVTSPAMLVVWGAGLALATQGQWFGSLWLTLKLGIVLALSALYGVLSGTLRRLASSQSSEVPSWLRHAPLPIVGGVTAIAVLVIVKPF
ncbi:CopD family protein [Bradyrhizobium sp. HKCCYLS1011]|uniref:CopD family protein n=1 Tax=Bradyrhizobium sp. HKCCYLS1011 TaxID=3420733 RepID=UPI003EB8DF5D